jgi:hypothetical protein
LKSSLHRALLIGNDLSHICQVKHQSLKITQSCPEFTSLPNFGRHLRKPNLKNKVLKQTRALSIFLMIPTLMLFLHNALGGIENETKSHIPT